MKNQKEYQVFNGERFEIIHTGVELGSIPYRDIWDCYERPSRWKVEIFADWSKWAHDTPGFGYPQISSYNCQMFTLVGWHYDENYEIDGHYYITKTRQELYLYD